MTKIAALVAWLTKNPNRVALYLTGLADVLAVALVLATDLQATSVVAVLTGVAAVNAKVLTWLKGWQRMESAEYQRRLTEQQRSVVAEQQAREAELVAKSGQVPGRRVSLPR